MILSLLAKYWKYILDALIIIALILLVFFVNPWNIFGGRLKTHLTANNVTAIRAIGQLITAEYYGEAISTIHQSKLQLIYGDSVNAHADILYKEMKQQLLRVHANNVKESASTEKESFWKFKWFRRAKREKNESIDEIRAELKLRKTDKIDSLAFITLEYYWLIKTNTQIRLKKTESSDVEKILWVFYQDIIDKTENLSDKEFDAFMQEGLPVYNNRPFSDYYYDRKREGFTRKDEKKELSMIGRGWVKAGFNFEKLDESNFFFDKEQGVVHLFGVHAEILNADINPWFIPEKKIPGFQIIEANRRVDFYDAVEVKKYCIEKLRKMAIDAGILQQAEMQGKETLKNFIGLLTGTEIKEVYFHYDKYTVMAKEVLNDEFISYSESRMLDTLIKQQVDTIMKLDAAKTNYTANQKYKEIKVQQMRASIADLKKAIFEEQGYHFNRLSSAVFRVTADSILTWKELKEIEDLRWNIGKVLSHPDSRNDLENKIWYTDPLEFITEFNNAIDEIRSKTKYYGNSDTTSKSAKEYEEFKKSKSDSIINIKPYDKKIFITFINNFFNVDTLKKVKYNVNIASDWQKILEDRKNIHSVQKKKSDVTDTLFIGPAISTQISQKEIKNLPVYLKDKYWNIDTTLKGDQKLLMEYFINRYKNDNTGFFTRSNKRLKEFLKPGMKEVSFRF